MSTIDFKKYDEKHPEIWNEFIKYCKYTKSKGFRHYSAKGIFELIRWHTNAGSLDERYKLGNSYSAYYARKMMKEFPAYEGFFRIKTVKYEQVKSDLLIDLLF